MGKQPTPQGISALLRKAGFDRSVSSSTRIRGWREWTEGFKVSRYDAGRVQVEYRPSSFRARETSDEQIKAMLDRYSEPVEAAGFQVKDDGTGLRMWLMVSATTDPDAEEATPNG